jgi:drug/metabolite transporter (DMT)-like permease
MQPTVDACKPGASGPSSPRPARLTAPSVARAELALVSITLLWGCTFLVIHHAMMVSGPFFFVGTRFGTAAIAAVIVFRRALAGLNRAEVAAGTAIAVTIYIGYGLQTVGLQTITSSKSAFITALYVPIVPLLQWLVMRRPPALMAWVGIALAFSGLLLIAGPPGGEGLADFGIGEGLTLVSTIAIAGEILLIGHFAGAVDARRVTVVQLAMTSLFAYLTMPVTGEAIPAFSWFLAAAAVGLGLATAVIQQTINWAQRVVSPTRATVIYTSETVFAGLLGWFAGDQLPPAALLGAGLIVAGVLVSELKPGERPPSRSETP